MTSRAASRVASATSRSPPSGDRPASAASARKRNRGVESAYGGKATGTGGTRRIYRPTDPRQRNRVILSRQAKDLRHPERGLSVWTPKILRSAQDHQRYPN